MEAPVFLMEDPQMEPVGLWIGIQERRHLWKGPFILCVVHASLSLTSEACLYGADPVQHSKGLEN